MPELPEVETVRRGLAPFMVGRKIVRAQVNRPDLRWPFPERFAERLPGRRVEMLRRRSKYLLFDLSEGETLLVHLGMSGRLNIAVENPSEVPGNPEAIFTHRHALVTKHDHVVLDMEDGGLVTFNDPRRFGAMDLVPTEAADTHWLLRRLGPEPLGNAFHAPYLATALKGRTATIKAALLDQRIVAGLGNIYVCEALHRAGISPRRPAGRIAPHRLDRLAGDIRAVLGDAIAAGGSSLRDYRQASGELGYFQHDFRVYGREGLACPTPGCSGTVRRIVQSGRSTFHCPACQR